VKIQATNPTPAVATPATLPMKNPIPAKTIAIPTIHFNRLFGDPGFATSPQSLTLHVEAVN